MLYIGLDPGESWCGFAALEVKSHTIRVEARTYSVKSRTSYLQMAQDVMDIIPHRETCVISEDFRIRGSGHQRFSAGNTLRLIGALEYATSERSQATFHLIPPNDNGERETRELFGKVLLGYRSSWPQKSHSTWGHCVSAWRVLGQHLFHHERDLLLKVMACKKSHRCDRWLPSLLRSKTLDRIASAAEWR